MVAGDVLFYGGLYLMGAALIVGSIHHGIVYGLDYEGAPPWWISVPFVVGMFAWIVGSAINAF